MRGSRRRARERLKSVRTVTELYDCLEELNLTDKEREVARLVYGKGWSLQQAVFELGYSKRQISRMLARVQDKM